MRPFALLSVLALTCSVLSQPAEFKRHAGAVDVRGVPIKHNHRSHSHQVRGDRSPAKAPKNKLAKRVSNKKKRCVAKSTSSSAPASTSTHTSSTHTSSHAAATTSASSSSNNSTSSSSGGGSSGGVVHITDSKCGANDPSTTLGKGTGPNGKQDWFNCNLNSGWTPPMIKMNQLVYVPLADALKMKPNQFSGCESLLSTFQKVAQETGVPDIMLASIAMQESSCNPKAYSAGSHGLFQLSQDLCNGVGGDCYDPETNTRGGANYINTLLGQFNGNIAEVIGNYNGWYKGIKPSDVQNMPCAMRQNWNYLQNLFNGWMQGINGNNNGNVDDGCNGADSD